MSPLPRYLQPGWLTLWLVCALTWCAIAELGGAAVVLGALAASVYLFAAAVGGLTRDPL